MAKWEICEIRAAQLEDSSWCWRAVTVTPQGAKAIRTVPYRDPSGSTDTMDELIRELLAGGWEPIPISNAATGVIWQFRRPHTERRY